MRDRNFGLGRKVRYSDFAKTSGLTRSPSARSHVATVVGYSRDCMALVVWGHTKTKNSVHLSFLE